MEQRTAYRVTSIDILRGLVMIIMAIDHTRDFFHRTAMTDDPLNLATTTVPLYFTRWITHYCAPTFVFLSGLSAFLAAQKKTVPEAAAFLIKRGFWLVLVEIVIVTLGITFNPVYSVIIWQVIWAIGWSMILLGLLLRAGLTTILVTGIILTFGHDLLTFIALPQHGAAGFLLKALFTARGTVVPVTGTHFIGIFYTILPWTGVMLMGYAAGQWFVKTYSPAKRKQWLLTAGFALLGLLLVLRFFNIYGDPFNWDKVHFLSFINTSKYPPSLLYLCMTIGPALIALALLENVQTRWTAFLSIYGRVPFFYYVLHFYLLHLILVIVFFATGHNTSQIVDPRLPFLFRPTNFGFGLKIVYLVWFSVIALLYLPCRWFDKYKKTHNQWWLRYV